jgi:cysteine desulfurase
MSAAAVPLASAEQPLYLDYAATTPVDARVAAVMTECLTLSGVFANPSSNHAAGRLSRARVEQARAQAATLIGCAPAELIFTSGATESNNLAILGTARATLREPRRVHLVSVRTEHKSVLDACHALEREGYAVTLLKPDAAGLIDPQQVRKALRAETVLVSIMHVNNEIGVQQDIPAIAAVCREHEVALHVDASQSVGKVPVQVQALGAQLLSFTAHKLYGPKGIGALYVANERRASLRPLLFGGGQERGLRPGTSPVHQIVGFGAACEIAGAELPAEAARIRGLRERLWRGLSSLPGTLLNGHPSRRVPGILNVSFEGVEGESLLAGLTELAVSTGSACNSDSDEPSYVLRALGRTSELAQSSLRFSLGRFSTEAEVDRAVQAVARELQRLRSVAP